MKKSWSRIALNTLHVSACFNFFKWQIKQLTVCLYYVREHTARSASPLPSDSSQPRHKLLDNLKKKADVLLHSASASSFSSLHQPISKNRRWVMVKLAKIVETLPRIILFCLFLWRVQQFRIWACSLLNILTIFNSSLVGFQKQRK